MKASFPHHHRGFSLVEVMVAIGIATTAVTLIIGLLPAGLSTFREAMNTSVTSQVGQRLLYEASQTDYGVLVAAPATKPWRYFDDEGGELPDANGAIYHALLRVQSSTGIPGSIGSIQQPNLATVIVQIALNTENRDIPITTGPGGPADPPEGTIDLEAGIPFTTFTGHVAKNL